MPRGDDDGLSGLGGVSTPTAKKKKRNWKRVSPAVQKRKKKEQRAKLDAAARNLMTTEGFKQWLDSRRHFRKYSIRNQMLINLQCPEATRVAGFKKWKDLGRQVRKGEKAIHILGWRQYKSAQIDKDTGEEKEVIRSYFPVVKVFDIAQTEGDPLPELPGYEPLTGESHKEYLSKLEGYSNTMGVSVSYKELSDDRGGYYSPSDKRIVINSKREVNHQVAVLIHEIAHAHGIGYDKYTREQAETMVEAVSYMVCDTIGLDKSNSSPGYLASWGTEGDIDALTKFAGTIDEVAAKIEGAIGHPTGKKSSPGEKST